MIEIGSKVMSTLPEFFGKVLTVKTIHNGCVYFYEIENYIHLRNLHKKPKACNQCIYLANEIYCSFPYTPNFFYLLGKIPPPLYDIRIIDPSCQIKGINND